MFFIQYIFWIFKHVILKKTLKLKVVALKNEMAEA